MDRKEIVTLSIDKFLEVNLLQASVGAIDDIVLTYLVGILEEVGNEDGFDVEDFSEMMEAYIPGFADISSAAICEWIFQLSEEVLLACTCSTVKPTLDAKAPSKGNKAPKKVYTNLIDIELPYTLPLPRPNSSEQEDGDSCTNGERLELQRSMSAPAPRSMEDSIQLLREMFPDACKFRVKRCLSDSDGDIEQAVQALLNLEPERKHTGSLKNSHASSLHETDSCISADATKLLSEMFPDASEQQVRHCLSIAKGDVQGASQVLLHLQESGQIEEQGCYASLPIQKSCIQNEADLKESLLQKYGFVDTDDDKKNHRPVEPKKEKKKMVRYINSQMVTTKGERFIATKKPDSEEMKKTYVNLKPARKYHFH